MKVITGRAPASAVRAAVCFGRRGARYARAMLAGRARPSRVPAQPGGAVPPAAAPGPAGPDWRTAIWRGRAPHPGRHGSAPPLRLPGPGSRLVPADRARGLPEWRGVARDRTACQRLMLSRRRPGDAGPGRAGVRRQDADDDPRPACPRRAGGAPCGFRRSIGTAVRDLSRVDKRNTLNSAGWCSRFGRVPLMRAIDSPRRDPRPQVFPGGQWLPWLVTWQAPASREHRALQRCSPRPMTHSS
jgi:hypothetical protein